MAEEISDINWTLLYISTYIFSIWDCYRTTVDINHNYILAARKYENRRKCEKAAEVVLIIECKENQLEMVKDILWSHFTLGVSKLDLENN